MLHLVLFLGLKPKMILVKFFSNILSWNKIKKIPSVGIGGINYRNLFSIKRLQLDYLAISSSIWKNKTTPLVSLKKIKNLIDNF